MGVLFLVLLDAWPVTYGQALVENLHSYDISRYDVRVRTMAGGLDVSCRVTLRVTRPGPLRFLLGAGATGLEAAVGGRPVRARLGAGGFERVVRAVAGEIPGIPSVLEVGLDPPARRGRRVVLDLRYRWAPQGPPFAYAGRNAVQTHLGGIWLPMMADELFDAAVTVETAADALAPGRATRTRDGWRFESTHPLQALPLTVARFPTAIRDRRIGPWQLHLLLPEGAGADPDTVLEDLAAVLDRLETMFGPGPDRSFALAVEPRAAPAPSYCGGSFVVVHRAYLPAALGRARWLAHLAHECAHAWWGHRVATPVIGRGGTWLREGLAQWSGIRVAGALLGADAERELFRSCFRFYVRRLDLRGLPGRSGAFFANEATLRDATYLDDAAVPYLRGALVLRRMERELGAERFSTALAGLARDRAYVFSDIDDLAAAAGPGAGIDYYARTTRLPDLALTDVKAGRGRATARITCADPDWPGGTVKVAIETTTGVATATVRVDGGAGSLDWSGKGDVQRIEIDPERIHLDPIRSNNLWPPAE